MSAPLVLADPDRGPFWPLAELRPPADLLAGTRTFRDRWAARFAEPAGVHDPEVGGLPAWPDPGDGWTVALSTWVPPVGFDPGGEPAEWRVEDAPVGWRLGPEEARAVAGDPPATPAALRDRLAALALPARPAGGLNLDSIWAVMAANPELIAADAADFEGSDSMSGVDPLVLLGDPSGLKVGPGVAVGPFVVLDVREGPIVLDEGARVEPHATLKGPLYVGPGSTILGGEVGGGTSIGPRCKVRGEVEQSIVQGYSNKAHDGFVGHSVIGEWANLGADTITSDLKNTYGPVRVEGPDGVVDTGLLKVGAFLGDHVKTGIGTLLTTGARIGVASHLFGGRAVSPRKLPDFSWFDGVEPRAVKWEPFERAARTAMARRNREMTDAERARLEALRGEID